MLFYSIVTIAIDRHFGDSTIVRFAIAIYRDNHHYRASLPLMRCNVTHGSRLTTQATAHSLRTQVCAATRLLARQRPSAVGLHRNAEFAGVDKAGVDNSAPHCRVGICRSGQISTIWQGWTLRHHVAGVDNAGVDNAGVVKCL